MVRSLSTEAQEPLRTPEAEARPAGEGEAGGGSMQDGDVWIRRAAPDDAVGIAALCSEVTPSPWPIEHLPYERPAQADMCTGIPPD